MVSIFSGLKTLYPGFPHRESGKRKRAGALGCLMMIILQKKMMKIIMVDVYAFPADVDIADHEMRYGFVKRKNWSRVVLIHNLSGVGVSSCQPRGGKCCTGQGSAQTACHRTGEKMCSMFEKDALVSAVLDLFHSESGLLSFLDISFWTLCAEACHCAWQTGFGL